MNDEVRIANEALSVTLSPLGAEMRALQDAEGRDLQWDGDPAIWSGRAPILFPIVGMLSGGVYRYEGETFAMPKHGFARRSRFEIVEAEATHARFRLSATDESRAIYPFEFQLDLVYRLDGPALSTTAEIANNGAAPMPASFGFHPALRWPLPYGDPRAAHCVYFDQGEPAPIRRIDGDGLLRPDPVPSPVEGDTLRLRDELFEDDALIFDALRSRSLRYGAPGGRQIEVTFVDFPLLGIWTKPGAAFVCIEPWHGIADPQGFAGDIFDKPGIMAIAPSEVRRLTMTIALGEPA